MNEKLYLKNLLESEQKYLHFLIESGSIKNKSMRESMLEKNKQELNSINDFLMKNCQHNVVEDFIDNIFNGLVKINYCDKCGLTLR